MKRLLSIFFLTFWAGPALAAEWGPWEHISGILAHDNSLEVKITGPGNGCEQVYQLKKEEPNYDVKATATLSAYYAGHKVSLFWSGSKSSCQTNFHRIKVRP